MPSIDRAAVLNGGARLFRTKKWAAGAQKWAAGTSRMPIAPKSEKKYWTCTVMGCWATAVLQQHSTTLQRSCRILLVYMQVRGSTRSESTHSNILTQNGSPC